MSAEGNLIDAPEEKPFPTPAWVDARNGIADTVGHSAVGATALAWANPSTGSAGFIEQIDANNDGPDGCRGFVTSRQSLDGITRFNGVACPSGDSWKLGGQ
ncbi:hypothetical protein FE844_032010 (plasmid) [Rhizobium indicum]|nr:hypothetical protein FE844_032010 [Rhizobium indicum]